MIGFMPQMQRSNCKYIKKVSALDKKQFIKLRGPDADPAAFNATRFWVNTGVKIELNDKKDPLHIG